MPNINLDFSSIPSREPLAEGTYEMQIHAVEQKDSSKGKPMVVIQFQDPETKTIIFENYVLQENCLWKLRELLDALGYDTSISCDFDPTDLVGQNVSCKVIQDTWDGSVVNRIKKIL